MAIYKPVKRTDVKPMVFDLEIENPPPSLVLLINPNTLEIRYMPKVIDQRVRWTGINVPFIFQAHHDELDTLTASGRSAMFISDEKGITRQDRKETFAYLNLAKLLAIYRNNGVNRNSKPNNSNSPCVIDYVGRVVLSYNAFIYRGHFTSFSITETDTSPFNLDFNFEYKVTKTFSLDYIEANNIAKGLSLL